MYLPSPLDVHRFPQATNSKTGATVSLLPDDKAELVCLAWKVVHHPQMGLVTYFRVMSGTLRAGMQLRNTTVANSPFERPNKVVIVMAAAMEEVPKVTAGNIGALVGLKNGEPCAVHASANRKCAVHRLTVIFSGSVDW